MGLLHNDEGVFHFNETAAIRPSISDISTHAGTTGSYVVRLCPLSLRAANEEHRCRRLRPRMVCVPASTRSDLRTYRRRCVFFFLYHIGLKTEHWSTRTQCGPWSRCGDVRKSAASLRSAVGAKTQMLHVASTEMNHMFVWLFGAFTALISVTSVVGHESSFRPHLPRDTPFYFLIYSIPQAVTVCRVCRYFISSKMDNYCTAAPCWPRLNIQAVSGDRRTAKNPPVILQFQQQAAN